MAIGEYLALRIRVVGCLLTLVWFFTVRQRLEA